ncbi:MAG: hypothetical protein AAF307_12925 [Pseudomonadota bacterium]
MGYPTKIATCCYCGSTAALKIAAGRHELSCATCGAPLRDLKSLPKSKTKGKSKKAKAVSHAPEVRRFPAREDVQVARMVKPRKVKRRKGWFKDVAEELFDFVEDILD